MRYPKSLFALIFLLFFINQPIVNGQGQGGAREGNVTQINPGKDSVDKFYNDTLPFIEVSEKNPSTAFALSLTLGWIGAHRMYLGTKPLTVLAYTFTGGGYYMLWMIDNVLLLRAVLKDDISDYEENPSLFMWR